MSDTTNLVDLPTNPAQGTSQNVVLQTTEMPNSQPTQMPPLENNQIEEQKMMNEIVTGVQQASASGATDLPSRDIPNSSVHFADPEVQANFVPHPSNDNRDYIQTHGNDDEILAKRYQRHNSKDSLEVLYDEFQIPIIIGLLYFLFQLPVFKSKLLSLLPALHNNDGNPNLSGFIVSSLFFSVMYYVISKLIVQLQNM